MDFLTRLLSFFQDKGPSDGPENTRDESGIIRTNPDLDRPGFHSLRRGHVESLPAAVQVPLVYNLEVRGMPPANNIVQPRAMEHGVAKAMKDTSSKDRSYQPYDKPRDQRKLFLHRFPLKRPMFRQRHKIRGESGVFLSWFESEGVQRGAPPPTDQFLRLQIGDVYIHWITGLNGIENMERLPQCQVWIYNAVAGIMDSGKPVGVWDVVRWGDEKGERRFVIRPNGFPSFVTRQTWAHSYRFGRTRNNIL